MTTRARRRFRARARPEQRSRGAAEQRSRGERRLGVIPSERGEPRDLWSHQVDGPHFTDSSHSSLRSSGRNDTLGTTTARITSGRGTSLIELLVVLALLSTMILVAADLIVHSMRLLDATGRAVRNPLVVHVTSRLRHDVQEAAGVVVEAWSWSEDPMILLHHDGSQITVSLEGGNLVRSKTGGAGAPSEQRVILRGVTSWWWRSPVPGVVDINITYLVNPEPERRVSRDPGYGLERRKENLRFAIRGSGGGARW